MNSVDATLTPGPRYEFPLEAEVADYSPSLLLGLVVGLLLSFTLWILVACAAVIVHLLSGCS